MSDDLYVGLQIKRDQSHQLLYVKQNIYIQQILSKFGFTSCSPISTPIDSNVRLDNTSMLQTIETFSYAATVESFQFCQINSCLDITYAIYIVAKFSSNPQHPHYIVVGRIFHYFTRTTNLALYYDGSAKKALTASLEAFCDANCAEDVMDGKSCTCLLLLLNHTLVAWCS